MRASINSTSSRAAVIINGIEFRALQRGISGNDLSIYIIISDEVSGVFQSTSNSERYISSA